MKNKLEKIVMIGPVYPYRGGIAHYTAALYKELKKKYEVSLISYKLQYPKFLFKKPQKDYSNDKGKIEEARFCLNTANPFNVVKTALQIKKQKPDLVIMQWWHPYFAPCDVILLKLLKKCRVLFICHNVFPHERFLMDKKLTKLTLKRGDGFITQSAMDAEDLKSIVPDAKCITAVHPTYGGFDYSHMSMEEARTLLGIEEGKKVLLFFGFVREYKGLKHLLSAMPSILEKLPEAELMVVGEFGNDREDYLKIVEEKKLSSSLKLVDKYVPDTEIQKYFAASDLVILPYESATQSGIVQIAFGFHKPVTATRVGGLPDVITDGKTGYLVPARDAQALADAVVRFFKEDKAEEFKENIVNETERFSWTRMREHVEELWELIQ